jgi:poly-gamma-glutamate capsule biosynthesis protein CapA/YwtB (metallophosphatase superfamily)
MGDGNLVLMGCGDVGPIHEPIEPYSALVRDTLKTADIRIGQVERVYSDRGALQVHSGGAHSRAKPHMASVFADCGFNVVSLASNHAMDWGPDALLDNVALFQRMGIQTVGAGRDLAAARRAAFVEKSGIRVAVLAYGSVLHAGYAAGPHSPGVAPLRANTYYEAVDYQPGVPPKVVTVPFEDDLRAMIGDIEAARREAAVVVVILHWGIHFIPRLIADYQRTLARAAFAAGADLILGHHAHVPKAVEVMDGKVCFYSLSNFIMSSPEKRPDAAAAFEKKYGVRLDPDYPRLPYGTDAKRSLIAKATLGKAGVRAVSFLPVMIDRQLRPEILRAADPRFRDMVAYMDWASDGFDHAFTVAGDEVMVGPRPA